MAILEDLVSMGDGGSFTDRVIEPIFTVISYEVREGEGKGEGARQCFAWCICFRIVVGALDASIDVSSRLLLQLLRYGCRCITR